MFKFKKSLFAAAALTALIAIASVTAFAVETTGGAAPEYPAASSSSSTDFVCPNGYEDCQNNGRCNQEGCGSGQGLGMRQGPRNGQGRRGGCCA